MLLDVRHRLCELAPAVLRPQRGPQRNDARTLSFAVSAAFFQPTCAMLAQQTKWTMRNTVRVLPSRPENICAHNLRF